MSAAWHAYDRLFEDDRVALLPEPDSLDPAFRNLSRSRRAFPKVWADAYIVAFAARSDGTLENLRDFKDVRLTSVRIWDLDVRSMSAPIYSKQAVPSLFAFRNS